MILSDKSILELIKKKKLKINPFNRKCLQPASLDLRLGKEFRIFKIFKKAFLNITEPVDKYMELIKIRGKSPFIIHPGEFTLGITVEKITIPENIVGMIEGRSSLGRLGIMIHSTAGFVDPGYSGKLTLDITNLSRVPISLYPGMKIAQISFQKLTERVEMPYYDKRLKPKYQHTDTPLPSRLWKEFEKKK